jgi:hypothetical protein
MAESDKERKALLEQATKAEMTHAQAFIPFSGKYPQAVSTTDARAALLCC